MQVHDGDIVQFFGFEFLIGRVDHCRSGCAGRISQGKINGADDWKTTAGIGEQGETDIGDAIYYSVVGLLRLGQGLSWKIVYLDAPIRAFGHLLTP